MSDTILTLKQLEDNFQLWTTQILGLNPAVKENQGKVRISYPTEGAPAWKITDDVVFIRINNEDDPMNKYRDTNYTPSDSDNMSQEVSYTRVHSVTWTLYGPNSFDKAESIRNDLFSQTYKDIFAKSNLFLVVNVDIPKRFPELYNGQWWERTDFTAYFNEKVIRNTTVPMIKTTNYIIKKG